MEKDGSYTTVDLTVLDTKADIGAELNEYPGIEREDGVLLLVLVILAVGHDGTEREHDKHNDKGNDGDVRFSKVGFNQFDVVVTDHAGLLVFGLLL
jgi:hypothetical protein